MIRSQNNFADIEALFEMQSRAIHVASRQVNVGDKIVISSQGLGKFSTFDLEPSADFRFQNVYSFRGFRHAHEQFGERTESPLKTRSRENFKIKNISALVIRIPRHKVKVDFIHSM